MLNFRNFVSFKWFLYFLSSMSNYLINSLEREDSFHANNKINSQLIEQSFT